MGSDYTIFERPKVPEELPEGQKPILENPTLAEPTLESSTLGSPILGNPTQLNTNRSSPDSLKTNQEYKNQENPYQSTSDAVFTEVNGWDRKEMDEALHIRDILKVKANIDELLNGEESCRALTR